MEGTEEQNRTAARHVTYRGRRLCAAPRDGRSDTWSLCTLDHGHDGDDHHIDWDIIRALIAADVDPAGR